MTTGNTVLDEMYAKLEEARQNEDTLGEVVIWAAIKVAEAIIEHQGG